VDGWYELDGLARVESVMLVAVAAVVSEVILRAAGGWFEDAEVVVEF